ncbi:hypothetical protein AKJ16_DCAP19526 [Drosera capensis]
MNSESPMLLGRNPRTQVSDQKSPNSLLLLTCDSNFLTSPPPDDPGAGPRSHEQPSFSSRSTTRRHPRSSDLSLSASQFPLSGYTRVAQGKSHLARLLLVQVAGGQIGSVLDVYNEQLIHVIVLLTGVFLQIFILHTAVSLIRNMSPPKRSS